MRTFWMTLAATGLLGLTACGGGGDAVAADPGAAPATDEAPATATAVDEHGDDAVADAPAAPEWTGPTQTVKTPTKEITAQKHVDPPADSAEAAIMDSLKLIGAGEFESWISKYCHSSYCGDPKSKESILTYNLPAAQKTAQGCLHEDGHTLVVTRHDPPDDSGAHRIYIWCGPDRMPPPASLVKEGDSWKVTSFSW